MKRSVSLVFVSGLLLVGGCSAEMAKRSAYESLQNKAQMDCRQNPGSACQDHQSYDEYQRSLSEGNTRVK